MTERLYYKDAYTTSFSARITEKLVAQERPGVVLDRTYFYPTGGGQPCDLGHIGKVEVIDVSLRPDDHAVIHTLANEIHDESVDCQINWPHRFDHMQHHTGQHILTRAFVEAAGANTISFHLSPDSVTIDLDMPQIQPEMLVKVENLANQIIFENRPVMANIVSPEEFTKSGARARKLPEHLATDGLRVIEIEGLDATACGGTHVARTGEIGIIKILRTERNGQETRVEFRCGQRALEDYRLKNTITHQLAAEFTVGIWEIDQAVARLKAEVKQAHSTCREMQEQLLEYEADQLLASARIHGKVRAIRAVFEDRDAANLRSLASRLKEEAYTIALLGVAGEKSQIILARSTELHYDMSKVLKQVLATLGTDRGGGRPEFAQGGGVAASTEQIEAALQDAESSILAEI